MAEGGAYGEKEAGGNSFSYWFLAVVFAGAAAFAAVAPHMVSRFTLQCTSLELSSLVCLSSFEFKLSSSRAVMHCASSRQAVLNSTLAWLMLHNLAQSG